MAKFWYGFFCGWVVFGVVNVLLSKTPDDVLENLNAWFHLYY